MSAPLPHVDAFPHAPGLYPDIPEADYHAAEGVGSTLLKAVLRSPAHYRAEVEHPRERTPAMQLGTAFHCLLFEPERFDSTYAIAPEKHPDADGRRKRDSREYGLHQAHKDALEAFKASGLAAVSRENWEHLHRMRDAVEAHPYARIYVHPEQCQTELSMSWTDAETGVLCRGRIDALNTHHQLLVDLKTAADASLTGFTYACRRYRYEMQAAFYSDGYAAITGDFLPWTWLAVETAPPYAVALYTCGDAELDLGRARYQRALRTLAECEASGEWPGYPLEPATITYPAFEWRTEE